MYNVQPLLNHTRLENLNAGQGLEFPGNVGVGQGQVPRANGQASVVLAPEQRRVEAGSLVITQNQARLALAIYGCSYLFANNSETKMAIETIIVLGFLAKSLNEYVNPSNTVVTDNNDMVTSGTLTNLIKILAIGSLFLDGDLFGLASILFFGRLLGWGIFHVDVENN